MQSQRDPRLNEILFPFFDRKRVKNIIDTYEVSKEFRAAGQIRRCWVFYIIFYTIKISSISRYCLLIFVAHQLSHMCRHFELIHILHWLQFLSKNDNGNNKIEKDSKVA